jgi:hypothetical protein
MGVDVRMARWVESSEVDRRHKGLAFAPRPKSRDGFRGRYVKIDLLSRNCFRASFPALLAASIVLKWTDDL